MLSTSRARLYKHCSDTAVLGLCVSAGAWHLRDRVLCCCASIMDQAGKRVCESEPRRSMARHGCAHGCGWRPVCPQRSSAQTDTAFHIPDPLFPLCRYHVQVSITSVGTPGSCAKKLAPGTRRNLRDCLHPAVSPSRECQGEPSPRG